LRIQIEFSKFKDDSEKSILDRAFHNLRKRILVLE